MACTFGQNKGKRGEREIVNILQTAIDEVYDLRGNAEELIGKVMKQPAKSYRDRPQLARNLMQSAQGGHDVSGLEWIAPEVKRQETLNINNWWSQTVRQAKEQDAMPVLFYKQNHKQWRVMIWSHLLLPDNRRVKVRSEIDLPSFLVWFKEQLKTRMVLCD